MCLQEKRNKKEEEGGEEEGKTIKMRKITTTIKQQRTLESTLFTHKTWLR
jgi:hypothetical protein